MNGYTIGQLAVAAGIPTSTIRYYERTRLLKPDYRTGGNYRGYSAASLDRLRFIRSAQATGFSLADVRELLNLTNDSKSPCHEVITLLKKRLEEVRRRIHELQMVEQTLSKSLKTCCRGNKPDLCQEITHLRSNRLVPASPI